MWVYMDRNTGPSMFYPTRIRQHSSPTLIAYLCTPSLGSWRKLSRWFLRIANKSQNQLGIRIPKQQSHLQLVEIVDKLLKALFKRDEDCRYLRSRGTSRLHHPFLVEEGLEAELKLSSCKILLYPAREGGQPRPLSADRRH